MVHTYNHLLGCGRSADSIGKPGIWFRGNFARPGNTFIRIGDNISCGAKKIKEATWLAYESYAKQVNDKAAKEMLHKILSKPQEIRPSINNLITAWALPKTEKPDEAKKLLNLRITNQPHNVFTKWAMDVYNGENKTLPDEMNTNENTRVLQQLVSLR